jgi:hypothetical protein
MWEPDGREPVCCEVSIDVAAVEEMARRAADNDGQVANAGRLRVRVLSRARAASETVTNSSQRRKMQRSR